MNSELNRQYGIPLYGDRLASDEIPTILGGDFEVRTANLAMCQYCSLRHTIGQGCNLEINSQHPFQIDTVQGEALQAKRLDHFITPIGDIVSVCDQLTPANPYLDEEPPSAHLIGRRVYPVEHPDLRTFTRRDRYQGDNTGQDKRTLYTGPLADIDKITELSRWNGFLDSQQMYCAATPYLTISCLGLELNGFRQDFAGLLLREFYTNPEWIEQPLFRIEENKELLWQDIYADYRKGKFYKTGEILEWGIIMNDFFRVPSAGIGKLKGSDLLVVVYEEDGKYVLDKLLNTRITDHATADKYLRFYFNYFRQEVVNSIETFLPEGQPDVLSFIKLINQLGLPIDLSRIAFTTHQSIIL